MMRSGNKKPFIENKSRLLFFSFNGVAGKGGGDGGGKGGGDGDDCIFREIISHRHAAALAAAALVTLSLD